MSFIYGFFDSINLDRTYSAENFTQYLSSMICNGVLDTYGNNFAVTKKSDTEVVLGTGKAWIGGHYFMNDAEYVIDMSQYVDASMNRYVTIAICCDTSESVRDCHLEIIPGTPAEYPYPAFPENTGSKTYLTLAAVHVWAASSTPVQENLIIDYRSDESKCGWCKCILGKCRVTEMLSQMEQILTQLAQYQQELQNTANALNAVVRRLGFANYPFPDIMGTGSISSEAASYMLEFSANVAAGEYAEYPTQQEKWAAFASENGLQGDVFPDVNGDGVINSEDAAIVTDFAAQVGAGTYSNTQEGFRAYMLDYDNAVFGAGISGFRRMKKEDFDRLPEKKDDIVYFITDQN